jgi:hypothetical protein
MKPVPHGEPYAGKLHVRFDEGAGVPDNKGRSALLYTLRCAVFSMGTDPLEVVAANNFRENCKEFLTIFLQIFCNLFAFP